MSFFSQDLKASCVASGCWPCCWIVKCHTLVPWNAVLFFLFSVILQALTLSFSLSFNLWCSNISEWRPLMWAFTFYWFCLVDLFTICVISVNPQNESGHYCRHLSDEERELRVSRGMPLGPHSRNSRMNSETWTSTTHLSTLPSSHYFRLSFYPSHSDL